MKFTKAYIFNFGKLSDYEIKFDKNIITVYGENGYGKSTIKAFLKAMFYGLETASKNSTAAGSERLKYLPFKGGKYGGNIEFIKDGKTYIVERTFDAKAAPSDTFKVTCDGNQSKDFTNNLGYELFNLDKESFERLLIISNNDIEVSPTSSMITLLGGTFDDTNLDKGINALETQVKNISKVIGSNNSTIKEKTNEIRKEAMLEGTLNDKNKLLNENVIKKDEIEEKILEYNKAETVKVLYKNIEEEELKIKESVNSLNEIKTKYKEVLVKEDVEKIVELKNTLDSFDVRDNISGTGNLKEAVEGFNKKYKDIDLSQDKLNHVYGLIDEAKSLEVQNKALDSADCSSTELIKVPTEADRERINRFYSTLKGEKGGSKLNKILGIVGVVLLLAAIPFPFLNQVTLAIVLLVLGLLCFVPSIINKGGVQNNSFIKKELLDSIKEFISLEDDNVDKSYFKFDNAVKTYNKISEESNSILIKKNNEIINSDYSELFDYFSKFNQMEKDEIIDYNELYNELIKEINIYDFNKSALESVETNIKENKEIVETASKELDTLLNKYYKDVTSFNKNELVNDLNETIKLNETVDGCNERIRKIKETLPEDQITFDTDVIEKLYLDKSEVLLSIDTLKGDIEILESELNNIEKGKEIIEELELKNKEINTELDIYNKTLSILKESEEDLKNKYVKPVKDKINSFKSLDNFLSDISMDKNYRVSYKEAGSYRDEVHLSDGLRSICALALRLSMLENIYKKDIPLLILDDPFAYLDNNHLSKAIEVINAFKSQVLYFTCHDSRRL